MSTVVISDSGRLPRAGLCDLGDDSRPDRAGAGIADDAALWCFTYHSSVTAQLGLSMFGILVPRRADNWLFAAVVICGASCAAKDAHAQLIQQYFPADIPGYSPNFSASVVNRMDAQDQAEGVEVGDFVIRPELSETAGYDSNTLGTPNSGSTRLTPMPASAPIRIGGGMRSVPP